MLIDKNYDSFLTSKLNYQIQSKTTTDKKKRIASRRTKRNGMATLVKKLHGS